MIDEGSKIRVGTAHHKFFQELPGAANLHFETLVPRYPWLF
jgi:hypothetical protein